MIINLKSNEKFNTTSKGTSIIPKKKYHVTTKVKGVKGESFCGYFVVIIQNNKNQEIKRVIQWLNDFSGRTKKIKIVFKAPKNSSQMRIGYRINDEVRVKSSCKFDLLELDKIEHSKAKPKEPENYTFPENFHVYEKNLSRLRELNSREEKILEKNLVWMFASPRSGTQWLGTQLLSHNTLVSIGPSIGLNIGSISQYFENDIVRDIELRSDEPDSFFSPVYKKSWMHFLRKFILNRIYSQFQNLSTKIIITDPEGSIGADIISECLSNSKIIILLRDGRDVIDSVVDSYKKNSWALKKYPLQSLTKDNRKSIIIKRAKFYVKVSEVLIQAYEKHSKKLRFKVKYEDLRKNTHKELKKLYNFIGIKITKNDLEQIIEKYSFENIPEKKKGSGKVTRSASPGKWTENFNNKEKKIIAKIIKDTLKNLGY